MRIKTNDSIFKQCIEEYPATKVEENADVTITIDSNIDVYTFSLRIRNGITNIIGGSELSCLWGFYEYLEKFYGAKWYTPTKKNISIEKIAPLRNLNIDYTHPYQMCEFHKTVDKDVRKWLNTHRVVSRRKRDTWEEKCLQRDWIILHKDKPEIFARRPDGTPFIGNNNGGNIKFRMDNPMFIELVAKQINEYPSDVVSLFPTDGNNFDSFAIPYHTPLYIWRGWVSLTKYYLEYYKKIAEIIPNKRFDIVAYSAYKNFPDNYEFDGSRFNCFITTSEPDNFLKWKDAGCSMIYRPNTWQKKGDFKAEAESFKRLLSIGMDGYTMDGYEDDWDTYGLRYYLTAMLTYKNKNVEDLINEYEKFIKS